MPQLLVVFVLVSHPLAATKSQSAKPGLQLKPQLPVVHLALSTLAPLAGQA